MREYDNFFLPAGDLRRGIEFYRDILGFAVKFNYPEIGMVGFQVGDREPGVILSNNPDAKPTIWFRVADVKEELPKMAAHGIRFLTEPFEIYTGWAVEFDDPFGNRLGMTDYTKIAKEVTAE